jgi:hypothetical protein
MSAFYKRGNFVCAPESSVKWCVLMKDSGPPGPSPARECPLVQPRRKMGGCSCLRLAEGQHGTEAENDPGFASQG